MPSAPESAAHSHSASLGSRLLRAWLLRPLIALDGIRDRLDAVEDLAFRTTERGKFRDAIKAVQDLERLVARAALGTAGPRDLVGLKASITVIPRVRTVLAPSEAPLVRSLYAELGAEALKEQAEWVAIYRQRPVEPPK